jgi:hypothetical protein
MGKNDSPVTWKQVGTMAILVPALLVLNAFMIYSLYMVSYPVTLTINWGQYIAGMIAGVVGLLFVLATMREMSS